MLVLRGNVCLKKANHLQTTAHVGHNIPGDIPSANRIRSTTKRYSNASAKKFDMVTSKSDVPTDSSNFTQSEFDKHDHAEFPVGTYFGAYKLITAHETEWSVHAAGKDCRVLKIQCDSLRSVLSELTQHQLMEFASGLLENMDIPLRSCRTYPSMVRIHFVRQTKLEVILWVCIKQ